MNSVPQTPNHIYYEGEIAYNFIKRGEALWGGISPSNGGADEPWPTALLSSENRNKHGHWNILRRHCRLLLGRGKDGGGTAVNSVPQTPNHIYWEGEIAYNFIKRGEALWGGHIPIKRRGR